MKRTEQSVRFFHGVCKAPWKLKERIDVDCGTAVASMISTYSCRHPGVQLKEMAKSPPGKLLFEAGGQ